MIGNFLFVTPPRPDEIAVWLMRTRDGAPAARLVLPTRLSDLMATGAYPPPAPVMAVESALSYGVFLALRSGCPLILSGDIGVWNPAWGHLTDLAQFPRAGLVPQPSRAR